MFDSYRTHIHFPNHTNDHEDDSGACSPPLWRTSPPASPHHNRQNDNNNYYKCLSPASKAQAIARGQKELMEMVSRMPESCYELSLKDLVEANTNQVEEQNVLGETQQRREKETVRRRRSENPAAMKRNGSINNGGFLLKMVFPVNLGSKKGKKKKKVGASVASNVSRVSPRPSVSDGTVKMENKEWWKEAFNESGGSESSGVSSINSGSMKSTSGKSSSSDGSQSRNSIRKRSSGCWAFIQNLHL